MVKMVVLRIVSLLCIFLVNLSLSNNDFKAITKIPHTPLMRYNSYSNVKILHYYIPSDTKAARFEFTATEKKKSHLLTFKCDPRSVSVYLKPGSYPVIHPDGVLLPESFLNISRPQIHNLTLQSDEVSKYINISSPKPGDWFAVSFLSWTDPRKDKIKQAGLSAQCTAYLYSELEVIQINNIVNISPNERTNFDVKEHKNQLFKFYVQEDIDHVLIEVDIKMPCKDCDFISIYTQTGSVPNEENYQDKFLIEGNKETIKYFYFWPEEENWHYLSISLINNNNYNVKYYSEIAITLKYISGLQEEFYTPSNYTDKRIKLFKSSVSKKLMLRNKSLLCNLPYKQYNLMRISGLDNYLFEYDFRSEPNQSTPLFLNISSNEMTVLKFIVHEIIDIGGTLTVGFAIKPINIYGKNNDNDDDVNYKLVGCLRANSREVPIYPDLCVHNNITTKAPFVLNSTLKGVLLYSYLPYPDPGVYYFSIRAFYDNCVPCNCSKECENIFEDCILDCELNCIANCSSCTEKCENNILEMENCEYCNCDGNCWKGNETVKNASVIFTISSNSCIDGYCGKKGQCIDYISGGFIFSSCYCSKGYRGWDCSDGSHALSNTQILSALLLLTLSNLLFIPSIYFAYRRGYYTETLIYFCSMFASTFYHACDSKEGEYGFCLFRLNVLQFCDFYCAIMTIWVTLVAMAFTSTKVVSLAHVGGAIFLAFSVTYNKHALWVFLSPAVVGVLLVGFNWAMQCRTTKKIFPAKKYLMINLPTGGVLVLMGLISYAFLETKENYKIIHSLWHVVMALSIIFLLPSKTFVPKT